jgi:lysozyme family protein
MSDFDRAYVLVCGAEGGFTKDPQDNGNWTGGRIGAGELKGTNGGISAAAYPMEDIEHLTPERRRLLFKRDYWDADRCDEFLWPINLYLFDDAVHDGQRRAVRQLQAVLRAKVDGSVGEETIRLAKSMGEEQEALFLASRIFEESLGGGWTRYGHDWAKRIILLAQAGVT